jgi:hypothetical protein
VSPLQRLERLLRGFGDAALRSLAREGPDGDDIEAELPGDAESRSARVRALVGAWQRRGSIDGDLLTLIRDRCPKASDMDEAEELAEALGYSLPPRPPSQRAERSTVRITLDADVDPRDLVEVVRLYEALRELAPSACMRFLGAGAGSLWMEVELDATAGRDLWQRWCKGHLVRLAGHAITDISARRARCGLPPAPRDLSAAQLTAWLRLAMPVPPDLELRGSFLDLVSARPALAMESATPAPRASVDLAACLIAELAKADPAWPWLPPEEAPALLAQLLDLTQARITPWREERLRWCREGWAGEGPWELAVEVPARSAVAAFEWAVDRVDAETLALLRGRCEHGLRLLLPRSDPPTPRRWARRDGTFFSDHGYLVSHPGDGLRETAGLIESPVEVLLGEPGAGKSTELRRLAEALWVARPQDRCQIVDLRGVGSHDHLRDVLTDLPWRRPTGEAGHQWLLIDSFDECLARVETLPRVLFEHLSQARLDGLRLRIACRTGAWRTAWEKELAPLFDLQSLVPLELLPLRRADVEAWADQERKDRARFMAAVDRADLGPLAARPVTLRLLLSVFDGEALPATRQELYERSLTHMLEEPDELRALPAPERVRRRRAAAGRIATVLLLGGKTEVELDSRVQVRDGVYIGELVGPERDASGEWSMTEQDLGDVLRATSLFVASGPTSRRFDHHTFAEHLAAAHLLAHDVRGERAIGLLWSEGSRRVVPQLHGLAAWLGSLDPQIGALLADRDPSVLLRADPAALTDDLRARIVAGHLDALVRGDRAEDHFADDFRAMSYPGLAARLARDPQLDEVQDLMVRRTVLRMAQEAALTSLIRPILQIALDAREQLPLRVAAAHAASLLDPGAGELDSWRQLASGAAGPDPELELRGTALRLLWRVKRDHVDLDRALDVTLPASFYGDFASFLYVAAKDLSAEDLPAVFRALSRWDPDDPGVRHLAKGAWQTAWMAMEGSPIALRAAAEAARTWAEAYRPIPADPAVATPARRRRLLDALIADPRCRASMLWSLKTATPALLTRADGDWARERLAATDAGRERDLYEVVMQICGPIAEPVPRSVAPPSRPDSGPALAAWQAEVDRHVAACERDPTALGPVLVSLEGPPAVPTPRGYRADWTRGWPLVDTATRQRILACARGFLDRVDLDHAAWAGDARPPERARVAMFAASLLLESSSEQGLTEAPWWPRHASAVAHIASRFMDPPATRLARLAGAASQEALRDILERTFSAASTELEYEQAMARASRVWGPAVEHLVRAEVSRGDRPERHRAEAAHVWLRHAQAPAHELEALAGEPDVPLHVRAEAQVTLFLRHGDSLRRGWWAEVSRDEELAKRVVVGIRGSFEAQPVAWTHPASELLDLYAWLDLRRTPIPRQRVFHAVTDEDRQEELRTAIPRVLVQRATADDIAALREAVVTHPELRWALGEAQQHHARAAWRPLPISAILDLLRRPSVRVVGPGASRTPVMPRPLTGRPWDLFLSHASPDKDTWARPLYDLLADRVACFYDEASVPDGTDWDTQISAALREVAVIAVLVSKRAEDAYYLRDEVRAAIARARVDGTRVVPIGLGAWPAHLPFGLGLKQGFIAPSPADLGPVADRLVGVVREVARHERLVQLLRRLAPDVAALRRLVEDLAVDPLAPPVLREGSEHADAASAWLGWADLPDRLDGRFPGQVKAIQVLRRVWAE